MGIYSVIAYGVAQRTNEFGIRFALGAAARDVIGLVMKEGLRLALVGLVVGLGLSFAVTRLMQRLLFEVSPSDPLLYSGVALFICSRRRSRLFRSRTARNPNRSDAGAADGVKKVTCDM